MCMPSYEKRIPLITSRFYAFYTEDFINPLRETWIHYKDNLVYQFILGGKSRKFLTNPQHIIMVERSLFFHSYTYRGI